MTRARDGDRLGGFRKLGVLLGGPHHKDYLEGQGDFVSWFLKGITRTNIWVIGDVNLPTPSIVYWGT